MTRLALVLAIFALCAGCADGDGLMTEHSRSIVREYEAQQKKLTTATAQANSALQTFAAEKRNNCKSEQLQEARKSAMEAVALSNFSGWGLGVRHNAGALVLDVADAAKKKSCVIEARELYDYVVSTFIGVGYAALRDRALVGIQDLRGVSSQTARRT